MRYFRERALKYETVNWALERVDRERAAYYGNTLLPMRRYEVVDMATPWKLWRLTPKESFSVVRVPVAAFVALLNLDLFINRAFDPMPRILNLILNM